MPIIKRDLATPLLVMRLSDALEVAEVAEEKTVEAALMPLPEEAAGSTAIERAFQDFGDAGPVVRRVSPSPLFWTVSPATKAANGAKVAPQITSRKHDYRK